ncbi:MAG: sensor histidine kinase, partial [Hyphomicrobiales bacterium]|nr:sensor histidine kinase [Hyphomicrobiales bacterium]
TPLSVITNEARAKDDPFARKVIEQAELMRDQVQHHLDRARMAARINVIGTVCDVAPVVDSLTRAMRHIHEDRSLEIVAETVPDLRFRGERHDLEEMVGNLLDNACKWANGQVRLTVRSAEPRENGNSFSICIEDDGAGLSPEERKEAARRGKRLDETKPGSGLGLSIVSELAGLYGGDFVLEDSALGGVRAVLTLPAV